MLGRLRAAVVYSAAGNYRDVAVLAYMKIVINKLGNARFGKQHGDVQAFLFRARLDIDINARFIAFCNDNLNDLSLQDSRKLFDKMLYNTKEYLPHYDKYIASRKMP